MNKENKSTLKQTALRENPGAAINAADNDKVSSKMVKQRVKTQNNNPRNTDMF